MCVCVGGGGGSRNMDVLSQTVDQVDGVGTWTYLARLLTKLME